MAKRSAAMRLLMNKSIDSTVGRESSLTVWSQRQTDASDR